MSSLVAMKLDHLQFLVLLILVGIIGANGGFPGIFCGARWNPGALANCNKDCITAHNALSGKCGTAYLDYNCYCDSPKATVNPKSVQCWDPKVPQWGEICTTDCRCDHGALDGICNYETHGCACVGVAAGFHENRCPFTDGFQLLTWFNSTYVSLGGPWPEFAAALLRGEFGNLKNRTHEPTLHV